MQFNLVQYLIEGALHSMEQEEVKTGLAPFWPTHGHFVVTTGYLLRAGYIFLELCVMLLLAYECAGI